MKKHKSAPPVYKFTGWWIPKSIVYLFEDKKINAKEVLLLAAIHSLENKKGYCYASDAFLAERLQISTGNVSRMLVKLRRLDLVETTHRSSRTRQMKTKF